MDQWIDALITQLGYWGIGLLMLLENVFPPLPSELIMPLGGFTAAQGKLNLPLVIMAGSFGSILGTWIWYWLGSRLPIETIETWVDRHGRWLGITVEDLEKSRRWFLRHGRAIVFWGRLVPGVRSLISLPAGVEGMALMPFLTFTSLGSILWVTALTLAGYLLRDHYQDVEHWLEPVSKIVVLAIASALAIFLVHRHRHHLRALFQRLR